MVPKNKRKNAFMEMFGIGLLVTRRNY